MRKKAKITSIIGISILFIVVGLVCYFQSGRQKITLNFDNEAEVFNIAVPTDFDQTKLDRIAEKKQNALNLYRADKNDEWTWINIGNLYEFVHDYNRAVLVYQKVVQMDKNNISALANLATIYEQQLSNYLEAERYYKMIAEAGLMRTNTQLYNDFASLYYLKMNNPVAAEAVYLKGLVDLENSPDLIASMIAFYKHENNLPKAKEYARKLVELYPDVALYKKQYADLLQ